MDNRALWRALAIVALAVTVAAGIGIGAYNAGMAQGIAESGRSVAAPSPGTQFVYVWPRPWGFGFFPFFPIFPFFFILFLFIVLRGLLWRGPWRGGRGRWHNGVPPAFDEWHRRAHGEQPTSPPRSTT
jgi:hypothetical protein